VWGDQRDEKFRSASRHSIRLAATEHDLPVREAGRLHPPGARVVSMKRQAEPCGGMLMGSTPAPRDPESAQYAYVGLRRFSSVQELSPRPRLQG
jgi:hypothetical protein